MKVILKAILSLFLLTTLPYYFSNIYSFSEAKPFSGEAFYNPYSSLSSTWVKANFHAHTKAYLGLAEGSSSPIEMVKAYSEIDYNLVGISNYNTIEPENKEHSLYLPMYEHGFNLDFTHQLAINSSTAIILDYPFFQWKSLKQSTINKQKTDSNLLALAHPYFKNSYTTAELQDLTNYDLIEMVSTRASSIKEWDVALSNGHAVWALGNDDAHDTEIGNVGVCWTMINQVDDKEESTLKSLKRGNNIAVRGWRAQNMNELKSLEIIGDTLFLEMKKVADSITLKTDYGKTALAVAKSSKVKYCIKPHNTYVRAEIFETEEWNDYTKMYLNPVIRSTSKENFIKHSNTAKINYTLSALWWLSLLIIHAILIAIIAKW